MTTTLIFMFIIVGAVAIFDVWVIAAKGKQQSISAYIIRISKKMPLVVLLFGIVLGHLFWSMDTFDHMDREQVLLKCEQLRNNP